MKLKGLSFFLSCEDLVTFTHTKRCLRRSILLSLISKEKKKKTLLNFLLVSSISSKRIKNKLDLVLIKSYELPSRIPIEFRFTFDIFRWFCSNNYQCARVVKYEQ